MKLYKAVKNGEKVGAVAYQEDKKFEPSPCLYRIVKVKKVGDVLEVPELVKSNSEFLDVVGIAVSDNKKTKLVREFKKMGAKVTSIDKMYKPSIFEYDIFNA